MPDLPDGYVAHPAADLFPLLTGDALKALTADIKANGLRQAIALDADGLVVDGRNRLIACKKAGVDPAFTTTTVDPFELVVSMNVKRRMLNKSQLAILAATALPMYREEAAKRQTSGKKLPKAMPKGKAVTLVGKAFGVSGEYVRKAETVLKRRPDLADEIMNLSADNSLSLFQAHQMITFEERMQKLQNAALADMESRQERDNQRAERREKFADALKMAEVAFATSDDIRSQVEIGVMTPKEAIDEHADRKDLADTVLGYAERINERLDEVWAESDHQMIRVAERLNTTIDNPDEKKATVQQLSSLGYLLVHLAEEWEKLL